MTDTQQQRWPIRTLTEADWPEMLSVDGNAFGATVPEDIAELEKELHEPGRGIGASDGETLVGIASAFTFELTVPGGTLPAAGVSWVGVLPTHRRRGVLSALMTFQLHSLHEAGDEHLAVLWASEPQIYGRFGYGMATRGVSMTVPRDAQALHVDAPRDPALRLRLVPPDRWELTADVYDRVRRTRAGSLARDERWWRRAVRDLASTRDGKSELRCVVAEDDRDIRGFARYATKQTWGDSGDSEVAVREVCATDAAALAALYRYLFDLDLMDKVSIWNSPVDDPLLQWLRNPRLAKPTLFDALYVRLVDLDRALAARTYAAPVDVVLAVTDDRCPWNAGRWRLVGGPDGATCSPSTDEAALALDVRELGAAYLGGTSLAELAMAGRVTELRPGTLAPASAAFLTTPAPWCPVVF